jgi:hypothetical protein
MDVGRDNAHFDANDGLSNALPCHRETVPAATVGWKLSESGGERGAVNVSADLVELVTVNLRAADTDHLTLLLVRLSGSTKLSQPVVHSWVIVCAEAEPTDRSTATANKNVFFMATVSRGVLVHCFLGFHVAARTPHASWLIGL